MAPPDHRRPNKRPEISDQQRRRELSLLRQAQNRLDAQHRARCLASSILSLENPETDSVPELELDSKPGEEESEGPPKEFDVRQASKLRGSEARRWFARQLLLPEWMIDVPDRLSQDWFYSLSLSLSPPPCTHPPAPPPLSACVCVCLCGREIRRTHQGINPAFV